uniref:Uncharacterized protein n=1 Tax=Opuntia streptacantha TaxID=393608 RepID=A0A7C9DDT0_OPUST
MPIKFDSLTSSKFPLQMLHLNHPFLIKSDHQPRIVFTTLVQLDRNQPRFPSQIDPGGIELVLSNNMLSSEHQRLRISAIFGPQSSGFSISFSLQVPHQKGHLPFRKDGNVEPRFRFGAGSESGVG